MRTVFIRLDNFKLKTRVNIAQIAVQLSYNIVGVELQIRSTIER